MFSPKMSKEDELRLEQLAGGPSLIEKILGRDNRKRRLAKSTEVTDKHIKKSTDKHTIKTKVKEYYP